MKATTLVLVLLFVIFITFSNGSNINGGEEEFINKIDGLLSIEINNGLEHTTEIIQELYVGALKRIKSRVMGDIIDFTPPIYNQTVIDAFASKTLLNPQSNLTYNPYDSLDFNTTLNNESVCAVLYPDDNDRSTYYLVNYTSAQEAEKNGAFVTHLHPCGYCSTTKDLSSYMAVMDMTSPIRDCAIVSFVSNEISLECIQRSAGLTYNCALIWLYDALNTRKDCLDICLYDWIMHVPNNVPANSTVLNPCIQCDEDKSGPVFKIVAARTRRDSGLKSAINRPPSSIYNITHYYY